MLHNFKKIEKNLSLFVGVFLLFSLLIFNIYAIASEALAPKGHGIAAQGDFVNASRLTTRSDGGRFLIPADSDIYSAKNDAGYFQSASEDTVNGYHGGLRDQFRIKTSGNIRWRTGAGHNWHHLDAADSPAWFTNEQVSDIQFMASDTGTAQILTVTCPAESAVKDLDTVTFPIKNRANVDTFQFSSLSGTTARDYIVVYRPNGQAWAAALNKTGSDAAPTGSIYSSVASSRKVNVNISTAVSAYDVGHLVLTAFNSLGSATSYFTLSDAASSGVVSFTNIEVGKTTDATTKNLGDTNTAASIAVTQTTTGFDTDGEAVIFKTAAGIGYGIALDSNGDGLPDPSTAAWNAVKSGRKILCDISASSTAAQVAAAAELCLSNITGFSSAFTTNDGAADGTMTVQNNATGVASDSSVLLLAAQGDSGLSIDNTTAGAASNYQSTYMRTPVIDSLGVEGVYYAWFNVGGLGTAPNLSDASSYQQIDVAVGASANAIANALEVSIEAIPNLSSSATNGIVTVTYDATGQQENITAQTSPVTVGVTREGSAQAITVDLLMY